MTALASAMRYGWGPKFKLGQFVLRMLVLATTGLCTKFDISTLTHYKDMKGNKNAKIWVVGEIGVTQSHRQHKHLIEHTRLPIRL